MKGTDKNRFLYHKAHLVITIHLDISAHFILTSDLAVT